MTVRADSTTGVVHVLLPLEGTPPAIGNFVSENSFTIGVLFENEAELGYHDLSEVIVSDELSYVDLVEKVETHLLEGKTVIIFISTPRGEIRKWLETFSNLVDATQRISEAREDWKDRIKLLVI